MLCWVRHIDVGCGRALREPPARGQGQEGHEAVAAGGRTGSGKSYTSLHLAADIFGERHSAEVGLKWYRAPPSQQVPKGPKVRRWER